MAVPTLDAALAQWSTNFNNLGTATPGDFGLSAPQMAIYTPLHTSYISAYDAAKVQGAKSKSLVIAKNDAKWALIPYARELYQMIQANSSVTNENKLLIGVAVRDTEPTPTPPPAQSPLLTVLSVNGRQVRLKLEDRLFTNTRRRPANAVGAAIFTFVGVTPPPIGAPGWSPEGQTGKTTVTVQFPDTVEPGTSCWLTAVWYNRRGEWSPQCEPVQTFLQIGTLAA
jgi:hypothetical protein